MNIQELKEVLENIKNNNTEILIENSYSLNYKINDYRLEQTSTTEKLYLIEDRNPMLNIPKNEDTTSTESTKQQL